MANFANLSNGSSGDEVKKLQKALIAKGYDVGASGADGIFGSDTESAVRKYQQDNSLTTDGIAGAQTQGKLYGTSNTGSAGNTNTNTSTNTPTAMGGMSVNTENFSSSDYNNLLNQAFRVTQQGLNSNYNAANDFLNQYLNRDAFSFNINEDAMYNQLKDQYMQQGSLMMEDAMGKAAAMTGGYGNSYAQSVGQQAYNQYMTQLNEMVPDIYGMALDRYEQEGKNMLNMYDLYMGRADVDYKRLMDQRKWEYDLEKDAKAEKANNYSTLYGKITSFGYTPSKAEMNAAGMTEQEVKALQDAYTASLNQPKEVDYKEMDYETGKKWQDSAEKSGSWRGIMSIWDRMYDANHSPRSMATIVKDAAISSGIRPSKEDLMTFAEKMEADGIDDETITEIVEDFMLEFQIVGKNPLLENENPISTHVSGSGYGASGKHIARPY